MAIVKTSIINCKTASLRKAPWMPLFDKEISSKKKVGDVLEIDTSNVCYDWKDRKFYKVINSKGWVYEGVIDYKGSVI